MAGGPEIGGPEEEGGGQTRSNPLGDLVQVAGGGKGRKPEATGPAKGEPMARI